MAHQIWGSLSFLLDIESQEMYKQSGYEKMPKGFPKNRACSRDSPRVEQISQSDLILFSGWWLKLQLKNQTATHTRHLPEKHSGCRYFMWHQQVSAAWYWHREESCWFTEVCNSNSFLLWGREGLVYWVVYQLIRMSDLHDNNQCWNINACMKVLKWLCRFRFDKHCTSLCKGNYY